MHDGGTRGDSQHFGKDSHAETQDDAFSHALLDARRHDWKSSSIINPVRHDAPSLG